MGDYIIIGLFILIISWASIIMQRWISRAMTGDESTVVDTPNGPAFINGESDD
jgi:hypothetical protein